MTPEAVIDRYLATATREPFDPEAFALLLGTDADLLSRWLQLLNCPAEPARFIEQVAALAPERFHDLAMSQALAVLTVSGSVRLSFDQWQSRAEHLPGRRIAGCRDGARRSGGHPLARPAGGLGGQSGPRPTADGAPDLPRRAPRTAGRRIGHPSAVRRGRRHGRGGSTDFPGNGSGSAGH